MGTRPRWTGRLPALGGEGAAVTVMVIVQELERRGLDAGPVLQAYHLPPRPMNPFARYPRAAVISFIEACRRLTRDPAFHVIATSSAELGVFHFADSLIMLAPSVGFALSAVMRGFHLFNSGCRWRLEEKRAEVVGHLEAVHEPEVHPIDVECAFIAFATRIRMATSGKHHPLAMHLATPDWGTGEIMARVAGCPVNHRADGNRLVFSRELWEAPPDLANPALEHVLAPEVQDADLVTRVRVAITRAMRRGTATVAAVARQLGWGERSLQRRLHSEGTSYAAELDDQRREAALAQIHQPDISVAALAERLGFSEPSAFTRAFRRWTGMSPSEFRRRGRGSSQ